MEIHHVQGNQHNLGLLMAYLPKEEILICADIYNPPPDTDPQDPARTPIVRTRQRCTLRYKFDYPQVQPRWPTRFDVLADPLYELEVFTHASGRISR
jgi:hypothetical protein